MTITDAIAYHRERSWHLLKQVDVELEQGEIEKASQALWDAAAHAIKAAAASRGWEHGSFEALCVVIDRLVAEEGGPKELQWHFVMANAFDRRDMVWEIPLHELGIRYCKEPVGEFIRTLTDMAS